MLNKDKKTIIRIFGIPIIQKKSKAYCDKYYFFGIQFLIRYYHGNSELKLNALKQTSFQMELILNYYSDVTAANKARGALREVQLELVKLMIEVDVIFTKNDIPYWLHAGSLLGAVIHNGFVPWDDDIDISSIMSKKQEVIDILENSDLKYELLERNFLKIYSNDSHDSFIDLTFYDELEHEKYPSGILQCDFSKKSTSAISTPRDVYFPIKRIEFEGLYLPVPNKAEVELRKLYGDYYQFPKKRHEHLEINPYLTFTSDEKDKIGTTW